MDVAERRRQVNGKAQKTRQIERLLPVLLQNVVERLTARVCPWSSSRRRPWFYLAAPFFPMWIIVPLDFEDSFQLIVTP